MTLHVDWSHYNLLVERLALSVHESGFRFNQIICLARGGLRVGDVLSRIFDQPLAILSTHSYTAEGGTIRGELVIAEHMTMTKPRLGDRVLIVDDMVDSGHTLAAVHQELPRRLPHIVDLKTAVLWWKACSVFKPDYWVEYLADNPWIHQPFEVYDDPIRPRCASASRPPSHGKPGAVMRQRRTSNLMQALVAFRVVRPRIEPSLQEWAKRCVAQTCSCSCIHYIQSRPSALDLHLIRC
jgi:hypoxanthine phosphoribosyltransferase